jgi:hypothetical protein
MAGFSDYLADIILQEKFRDAPATKLGTVHVALFSAMPNNAGVDGTELSAGNYARASLPTTDAGVSAPAANGLARQVANASVVDFGTANADWAPSGAPAVGFGLYDAATGGNYLGGTAFASSKVIQNGDPVRFNAGELKIQLTRPS